MLTLIWLLLCAAFQITSCSASINDGSSTFNDDQYDGLRFTKRYLGSLAKNNKLPIQHRSYIVPPMVSPYGNGQKPFAEEFDPVYKRYLGSLAKSGDLRGEKPQQKKSLANEELDEPKLNKEELLNPTIIKQEMIQNLKQVIIQFLIEMSKKYDPKKVDLFLENLVNTMYDQNDEISLESIKALVQSDYFLPEDNRDGTIEVLKRNIQSLVRDFNVSYSGITPTAEMQMRQVRGSPQYLYYYTPTRYGAAKRNLESLIKNKSIKRYVGAMAKNFDFPTRPTGKRDPVDEPLPLEYASENVAPQFGIDDNGDGFFKHLGKRHTMYDINEPDITFEYPSQAGDQNDYNDYAEQMGQDAPIPIGKRYLAGANRHGHILRRLPTRTRQEQNCRRGNQRIC